MWMRWGTGDSMRALGEKIGISAAGVSQIEKGQRALKDPKIALWAAALEVDQDDLHELWLLCQGLVPADERPVFYTDQPDALRLVALKNVEIQDAVGAQPGLELIYRLALRICEVLIRLLPQEKFAVQPRKFEDPIPTDLDDEYDGAEVAFVPLPAIWVMWSNPDIPNSPHAVVVPFLKELTPIVRQRVTSMPTASLEALLRTLSATERERVRGYIEAVLQDRSGRN